MRSLDLFDFAREYPHAPGFKARDTSRDAARAIAQDAPRLRDRVLATIRAAGPAGISADEAAAKLGRGILSVRPRVTELYRMGEIEPVPGARRRNASGMSARAWRTRRC